MRGLMVRNPKACHTNDMTLDTGGRQVFMEHRRQTPPPPPGPNFAIFGNTAWEASRHSQGNAPQEKKAVHMSSCAKCLSSPRPLLTFFFRQNMRRNEWKESGCGKLSFQRTVLSSSQLLVCFEHRKTLL